MSQALRLYHAIVWTRDPDSVGVRVELLAESLDDAEAELKTQYGEEIVFTLFNREDAERPRPG